MSITINDPALLAQLKAVNGPVDLRGPDGEFLFTITPPFGKPPPGFVSPISDEEFQRRREKYRDGKPLSEILKRLESTSQ